MSHEPEDERWREYEVTPRYLAGSSGIGDPGFEPVRHWPHHVFDDGPCQLMVASPDHRIKIGWFGDDIDPWKITVAEDALAAPHWQATFNHAFPPEIVAGFTEALAHDWSPESERFLTRPSMHWSDNVQPLLDAGWVQEIPAKRGTVPILSPDEQAGALIDSRSSQPLSPGTTLWAGPPGWASHAEATFTVNTPSHLVAATAKSMLDPNPVIRERHMIHQDVEQHVQLVAVPAEAPSRPRAPTPLDVKQAAVTAAVNRAAHSEPGGQRAQAARIRTTHASPQDPNTSPAAPHRTPDQPSAALTRACSTSCCTPAYFRSDGTDRPLETGMATKSPYTCYVRDGGQAAPPTGTERAARLPHLAAPSVPELCLLSPSSSQLRASLRLPGCYRTGDPLPIRSSPINNGPPGLL